MPAFTKCVFGHEVRHAKGACRVIQKSIGDSRKKGFLLSPRVECVLLRTLFLDPPAPHTGFPELLALFAQPPIPT